jgi:hypothetical protein
MCSFAYYFFIQLIIVWLNEKFILINKFSKYSCVNIPSCEIKYLNLYLPLIFLILFLVIVYEFLHLLTHIVDLFDYIYA